MQDFCYFDYHIFFFGFASGSASSTSNFYMNCKGGVKGVKQRFQKIIGESGGMSKEMCEGIILQRSAESQVASSVLKILW